MLSATILLAVTTGLVVTPGTAQAATGVSNVTVGISPPTSAARGLTTYAVSFTTSSTGELDGTTGSTVTIALPPNTGLGSLNDGYYYGWGYSPLEVGATQVGYCNATDTSASTPHGDLLRLQRVHGRRLDHGDGHPHRRDQSAGRLTHAGRVDHLGCHPGDLTLLRGDGNPIGERGGSLDHATDLGGRRV